MPKSDDTWKCIHNFKAVPRQIKHNLRKPYVSVSIIHLPLLRLLTKEAKMLTFPRPLKKEPHNENLQASHTDH